jgi:dihydrofolate synthase/folylpolyglutamate synthase
MEQQKYLEVINYLYSLQRFGIKLGLHNIERLLKLLQNPEEKFTSIHIAGTNGKGSTSSFIASILSSSGYKVGLYTSPHLVDFTERIRINGAPISRERVVEYVEILRDEINLLRATFFEVTTAIAFKYFADEKVDFAVVEVGLGGRLDSTNVIKPAVSVITTVSFDHMDVLGEAIEQIAFEKAGIIKEGIPCVTGCEDEKVLDVIKKVANEKKSELVVLDEVAKFELKEIDEKGVKFDLKTRSNFYSDLVAGVGGSFQVRNSSLSVLAYEKLCDLGLAKFKSDFVYDGLLNVVKFSGLRGRLEILKEKPKVVADVAHNYPAICQLASELGNFKRKRTLVLFGVMKDKEYEKMIKKLSEVVDFAVAAQPKIGRALNCKTIAEIFKRNNVEAIEIPDSDKAYDFILDEAGEDDLILVTGSHYLVGEVIAHIERRKIEILI